MPKLSPDWLIFLASLVGITFHRLSGPNPNWSIPTLVDIVIGGLSMLVISSLTPNEWIEGMLSDRPFKGAAFIALMSFFTGPGIVAAAKAVLYEKLPTWARDVPPGGGAPNVPDRPLGPGGSYPDGPRPRP